MSASEDSEVDDGPDDPPSSFTSNQPPVARTLALASNHFPDVRQFDDESDFVPDIGSDDNSDDVSLPVRDNHQVQKDEALPDYNNPAEPTDSFAAEESYYTRPNRYYGPASTWRSWTKDDREVAEALELERAQDLSIHLYNAHAVRTRTQKSQSEASRKRRRGATETEDPEDKALIFEVPKVWTAWPMPPDQVPRNEVTAQMFDKRPSKELEECLIGVVTKAARERWDARKWRNEEGVKQLVSAEQHDRQIEHSSDAPNDQAREVPVSGSPFSTGDDSSAESSDDVSESDLSGEDPTARPTTLADDDKVRHLLLPSTRHVISQLDHLLMALHHARQSYALPMLSDEDEAVTSSETDGEPKKKRSSSKERGRPRKQRASSVSSVNTEASLNSSSSRRKKGARKDSSKHQSRRSKGLGLRDWSDVLGMAALSGWNEDVVARASKRCAELLGENMLFRKFHEATHEGEKSFFTETLASWEEPQDTTEGDTDQNLWTQATSKTEDFDPDIEPGQRYPCPIESCPRHRNVFRTAGNLKQHIVRSHAQCEEEDDRDAIADTAMRDGRQVVCPIQTCRRSREPFLKGSKLYVHVRNMHPEVNIEELKKLQAQWRSEARGKWPGQKRKKNPYERS